jgi:hypothetical protein
MKIKPGTIVLIVILAVTLFLAGSLFTHHGMKTILVPAIACGIILVLGAVQLSKELIASAKTAGANIDSSKTVDEEAKQTNIRYLVGFGWLAGFAIAIYLIGFIYSTFLLLFLFIRFNGKRSWFKSVMIAVLGTAVFWLFFVYWLQSDLWGGAIFNLFNLNLPTLTVK